MKNHFYFFVILLSFQSSCKKKVIPADIHCEHAQLCLGNLSSELIYYGWECNYYTDSLAPGEVICIDGGAINIEYSKKSGLVTKKETSVHFLHSSRGDWYINLEKCSERSNFNYDPKNHSSILLYDEGS